MFYMDFCSELLTSEAFIGVLFGVYSPGGAASDHVGPPLLSASGLSTPMGLSSVSPPRLTVCITGLISSPSGPWPSWKLAAG